MLHELQRVEEIIRDFLSLARNRVHLPKLTGINDIIKSIYPLINTEGINRTINIEMKLAEALPGLLLDEGETKQLILNLVQNGLESMDKQGVLSIETTLQSDKVLLCVTDSGCGIPSEMLKKVFDPFYTTKQNGTGLGLSVCASIVERHNGTITVESKVGKGTRITVGFPIQMD